MSSPWIKPVRQAIWAAALAVAFTGMTGSAWAQGQTPAQAKPEEDDIEDHILNADKRLLNSILGPLGLGSQAGPDIDFRERSPLVVPQGRDLPVPGKSAKGADWPIEPEVKAKRAAAAARKAGLDGSSKLGRNDEKPISGTAEAKKTGYNGAWGAEPGKGKEEPGFFSMLWEGKLKGSWEEESAKFEGEPPRVSLTEPPTGYLTPSPAAPYGATKREDAPEKKEPKL